MGNIEYFYSWQRKSKNKKIIIIASIIVAVLSISILSFVAYGYFKPEEEQNSPEPLSSDFSEGNSPSLESAEEDIPVVDNRDNGIYSGLPCDIPNRRPIALTVSSDTQSRPSLGLSQADMIFEVPSTGNSARHTRLLALFSCYAPEKVRSIRSSRKYFGDLTMAVDGIMAHWGASQEGKAYFSSLVNKGELDRIDALVVRSTYFTRNYDGVSRKEDSGTANVAELFKYADDKGWETTTNFEGYPFLTEEEIELQKQATAGRLSIGFKSQGDRVYYDYDPTTNKYKRFWGGVADKDGTTGQQIEASNIVVMQTKIVPQSDPHYVYVTTTGSGLLTVYQNGTLINGTWERGEGYNSKLYFYDNLGEEIELTPGQTWIEFIESSYTTSWQNL